MKNFKSLGEFERFLLRRVEALEVGIHTGLDVAASIVEKTAKDEIGHYQDAAGPYPAWAELAESTKEDRLRKGFTENDPLLRTGQLRDSISRAVDGHKAVVGSTSDIMVFQELGTSKMPPRPVLGLAAYRSKEDIKKALGESIVAVLTGRRLPKPKNTG